MEIEVSVTLLLCKLRKLLALEGIVYSRSRVLATKAINELDLISKWIRDAKEGTINSELITSNSNVCLSMEDFIDEFIVKAVLWRQNNFIKIVPPLIRLASLWDEFFLRNEMDRVIDHAISLKSLCATEKKTGASGSRPQLPQGRQIRNEDSKAPDDSDYIRLYDEERELVALLFDERRSKSGTVKSIVAVTGEAGSGKTVLTKTVYNMKNVKRFFNHRAWVNVSENFEARDFLVDILTQFSWGNLDENLSDDALVSKLVELAKKDCCLIVVDDVRTHNDLDKLSYVLRYIGGRSRLILTTRNQAIACAANPQRDPVWVRSLTDDESWALFLKKAPMAEDRFETLEELISFKMKILRKCVGSPQAILILGGLLSTTDPNEWKSVIEQLSTTDIGELSRVFGPERLPDEELKELSRVIDPAARKKILDLSYQDLPPRMKFCFLYLGLFPRAVYIPVRRLFHHWLAEGWVTPLPKEQMGEDPAEGLNTPLPEPEDPAERTNKPLPEPEDLAEEYFNQLIRRNMIEVAKVRLDGSPKTCRMPGSIWDVFRPKALDLRLFHVHDNTDPSAQTGSSEHRIQRLAEYTGMQGYPPSDSFIQYLRTYVSFNTRKRDLPTQEIGKFLTSVVTKRGFGLLIVLDLEKVYKPTLPDILGKLLHLKYLGLRWTFLDSLPMSVGNLPYLETLDVKHTTITTLPSSIWKAKNLRHLYLNEIYIDMSIKQPNSGSLTNIRTLWGLFIGRKSHVETCLDMLIGLRKLGLTCNSSLVGAIADWISKLTDLQSLRLRSSDQFGRPSTLELREMQSHSKLSDLYLVGQLTRPIDQYQFPLSLKIITLSVSNLKEDPMPILGQLSELNILRLLRHSYTGEKITCGHDKFVKLRVLKLWMLENLEEWNVEEGAMPQLEELEIRSCDKLNQPKNLQRITKLKEVTLTNMPKEFVAKFKRVMATATVRSLTWESAPSPVENAPRQ